MSVAGLRRILIPSANPLGECPVWMYGSFEKATSAIIVIQEWWGVNEYIKKTCQEIGQGAECVTILPDLYRGKVADDRETAGHLSAGLDWSGALQDVDACAKYLKTQGIKKVGVTGFCMGGALTVATAALTSNVDAAVPFYGIAKKEVLKYEEKDIKIPIQCHFGNKDAAIGLSSPSDYEAFKKRLEEVKANFEFYVYDAGHAFANPTSKLFVPEAKELSFSRMYKFFAQHLATDQ